MKNLVQGLIAAALLLVWAGLYAAPIAAATAPGVTVTLFSDKCKLPAVKNLPLRATWTQDGKTVEGCFGGFTEANAIGIYFEDGTVAVIPAQAIKPLVTL
jgi:hypothetical protein